MKKTHDANIGGTIFHVEEDAYGRLEEYLASIAAYFSSYEDSADIVSDIEGRIAEQLSQGSGPSRIVSLGDVERVIVAMGRVDQFVDGGASDASAPGTASSSFTSTTTTGSGEGSGNRRLFRDEENGIIAGVAAGIAAFIGVNPMWVRIALVVLVVVSGVRDLGVLICLSYLVIWVAVPVAKTTTDKLRMRGNPVTLAAVEQGVRDRVAAIAPGTRTAAATTVGAVGTFIGGVGAFIRKIVETIARFVGLSIVVAASIGILVCTAFLVILLVNVTALTVDRDFIQIIDGLGAWYSPLVLCCYLLVVVPLALIALGAFVVRREDRRFPASFGMALAGLWLIALFGVVGIWANYYPRFRAERFQRYNTHGETYNMYRGGELRAF